jgi:hypothetical protein
MSFLCARCNKQATHCCTACRFTYYCSREHQQDHWIEHRLSCGWTPPIGASDGSAVAVVVITAPHAACFDVDERRHTCDAASGVAARLLAEEAANVASVHLFENTDVHRMYHDLNRVESRMVGFRRNLTPVLLSLSSAVEKRKTLLVDVHSFPPGHGFGTDDSAGIVFMEPRSSPLYSAPAMRALHKSGFTAKFVEGHHSVNDIELEARERGIPAFLMEVREDSFTEGMLRKAMKAVASTIQ